MDKTSNEKPLSGPAKIALMSAAGAAILAFYGFVAFCLLGLLIGIAAEAVLLIVLLRFGFAGFMLTAIRRQVQILKLFFASFWIQKGAEFRIPLQPDDAPGLFATVRELCERLQILPPDAVSLELSVGAWVRLKGYRRGAGKTELGIGYDLIAGLSEPEIEAVVAHELAHAKLVQRGLKYALKAGLARAIKLTGSLDSLAEAYRRAKITGSLAEALSSTTAWLTRRCVRLVAAYSRQDEFEADRGAAELCGPAPIRSALEKLEGLEKISSRLPLRERIAQFELQGGYSQWLLGEMKASQSEPPSKETDLFNRYSTHPTLRDRLAALPAAERNPDTSAPSAIELLANPDTTAKKLIDAIQRVLAAEEEKDTKGIAKLSREGGMSAQLRPLQVLGLLGWLASAVLAIAAIAVSELRTELLLWAAGIAAAGVGLYKLGRYNEKVPLPVPDYELIQKAWPSEAGITETKADREARDAALRSRAEGQKGQKRKATFYASECYAALGQCDYLQARAAAELCLTIHQGWVEGHLGRAIALAALQQTNLAARSLYTAQKATASRGASMAWGSAWTLLFFGNWVQAEAFLLRALKERPGEPTWLALLALAQSNRGKFQSAIVNARQACGPAPGTPERARLLVNLLLNAGYIREAEEWLLPLEKPAAKEPSLMLCLTRFHLLRKNFDAADQWSKCLVSAVSNGAGAAGQEGSNSSESANPPKPTRSRNSAKTYLLVRAGESFETARRTERAVELFQRTLETGHFPEAWLGLARIEAVRQNDAEAKRLLYAALDITKPLADGAAATAPLFSRIVNQFLSLQEPVLHCQAWIATLPGDKGLQHFANRSLLIYATEKNDAEQCLGAVLRAMRPSQPPLLPGQIIWQEAPKRHQPDGPTRPGIQWVLG